jgi:hypothetical protein
MDLQTEASHSAHAPHGPQQTEVYMTRAALRTHSSICVAQTTNFPAMLHLVMSSFCASATFSDGISIPRSPAERGYHPPVSLSRVSLACAADNWKTEAHGCMHVGYSWRLARGLWPGVKLVTETEIDKKTYLLQP